MVNLLITMRCNRNCDYCFAKEKRDSYTEHHEKIDMKIEDLDRVLDFLVKSGCDSLQLAGGEPTIHREFDEMLMRVLKRGIYVNVLSNCLWDEGKNKIFSRVPPTKLGFLINVDHPDNYSRKEWEKIEENLKWIRERENTTLSFNIFEKEPRSDYIFDLVSRHDIKNLRLSFSMPVVFGGERNKYLPLEEYKDLTPFLMKFIHDAEALGVKVRFDNTVPVCMFSKTELGELLIKGIIEPQRNFVCFPAIDIGPDLSIWRCFGTSGLHNKKLNDFDNLQEICEYYERAFRPYQFEAYPMEECYECEYAKEQICQGGCIGFSASKRIEEEYPWGTTEEDILNSVLKLNENSTLKKYEIPEELFTISLEKRVLEINAKTKKTHRLFRRREHSERSHKLILEYEPNKNNGRPPRIIFNKRDERRNGSHDKKPHR